MPGVNPKVSIITVCYNAEKTISDTIDSVLSQTYSEIEYVIVDGKSVDDTMVVINKYKDRITKIISEKDEGIYDAMNKGILNSTGDIVGFIGADDVIDSPLCIERVVAEFNEGVSFDAVFGDKIYTRNDLDSIVRIWKEDEYNVNKFRKGWMPPHQSTYIKRSAYDKYGLYKINYKIAADYELLLRMFYRHGIKAKYLPMTIARMRVGGTSNKSLKNIIISNIEAYKAWQDNGIKISPLIMLRKPLSKIKQLLGERNS